ncbi:putative Ni/Fe-hydrogenase B-type cytochrome subunit [bacterium BMS3Bbin10]|nr:putative Ni/Fe-hydrogenase B-type cytochrome subunit [bacterium BMS3Bbin10]
MTIANDPMEAGRVERPVFIKVWDPFVRVFHWSLVALFILTWISADEWDRLHELTGYAIAGLVGLRLVWGLIGARHARFPDFVYRPSAVIAYVKDIIYLRPRRYLGHNPAGGAMVLALLLSLTVVAVTGVMSVSDIFWGKEWVEELHEGAAYAMLALVFLHIAGVVLASIQHRENLVSSMFSGLKRRED